MDSSLPALGRAESGTLDVESGKNIKTSLEEDRRSLSNHSAASRSPMDMLSADKQCLSSIEGYFSPDPVIIETIRAFFRGISSFNFFIAATDVTPAG